MKIIIQWGRELGVGQGNNHILDTMGKLNKKCDSLHFVLNKEGFAVSIFYQNR